MRKNINLTIGVWLTAFLFNYLFYGNAPGISFPIFFWVLMAAALVISNGFKVKLLPSQMVITVAVLIFSFFFSYRDAGELRFGNFFLTVYLTALFFIPWVNEKNPSSFTYFDYAFLPGVLYGKSLVRGKTQLKEQYEVYLQGGETKIKRIIIGLLVSIPLVIVFIALMSSADLVFEKLFKEIWKFINRYVLEGVYRSILIVVMAALIGGLFAWIGKSPDKESSVPKDVPRSKWGFIETTVVVGAMNLLFLIFGVIQVIFLIGGESRIAALGVTYSQYARQGFFQMIAIAVIALLVSFVVDENVAQESERHRMVHKSNVILTSVMTGIMMISAFYRLWLYEEAYGFTVLRFYSHSFIIFVAVIFALLCMKVVRDHNYQRFLFSSFVSSLLLIVLWNLSNPHYLIARINLHRHFDGARKLDTSYLWYLSNDAVPAIVDGAKKGLDPETEDSVIRILGEREARIQSKNEKRTRPSLHLGTQLALRSMNSLSTSPLQQKWEKVRRWKKIESMTYRGEIRGLNLETKRSLFPEVVEGLASKDRNISRIAGEALMGFGPEVSGEKSDLIRVLGDESADEYARGAIAIFLGKLEAEAAEAAPALVIALKDKTWALRKHAAEALEAIGPRAKDYAPNLLESLNIATNDQEEQVRAAAMKALVRIDPSSREGLSYLIANIRHQDRNRRIEAIEALAKMGSKAKEAVPNIVQALRDRDEGVRATAALALRIDLNRKDVTQALIQALNDQASSVRGNAAHVLGETTIDEENVIPALVSLLKRDPQYIVVQSIGYLGRKSPTRTVPLLSQLMTDNNQAVREAAAHALGRIGPSAGDAVPSLIQALKDTDGQVREKAKWALKEIGTPEAKKAVTNY